MQSINQPVNQSTNQPVIRPNNTNNNSDRKNCYIAQKCNIQIIMVNREWVRQDSSFNQGTAECLGWEYAFKQIIFRAVAKRWVLVQICL